MTQQEFRKTYLNLEVTALVRMNFHPAKFVTNVESPDELNFIEQGYLKGVKYQERCRSCYAFAAIANIEDLYFNKFVKNKEFSE